MDNQLHRSQQARVSRILREKELWLLVFLGVLWFYRPLFLQETFFFRDLCLHDLPDKQLLVNFIHNRELPLWDPYKHGGRPYLGNIIHFTLYPANLLYLFLPLIKAFNLTIVLHFLGCSACAYLCARVIGLQPVSSCIVGLIYGYCGYVLSLANILNRILAMPYIPLLLAFWHLALLQRKRRWFIITVVAGVLQVLTGAPETSIMSLVFLLGWGIVYLYPRRSHAQILLLWGLLGLCIVGIASIQLLPTLEVVAQSSRRQGVDYATFGYWSLYPGRLPELVFPGFFGHIDTLPLQTSFWGHTVTDEGAPYIISIYFGWATLILTILGGVHRRKNPFFPLRVRAFLFSLVSLSLFLSFGRFLPYFPAFYQHVPFIAVFRYPIKFLIAGIFPVTLLAGYASEIHFGHYSSGWRQYQDKPTIQDDHGVQWVPSRKMITGFWGICAILLVFTVMLMLSENFSKGFQEFFFKQSGSDIASRRLLVSFGHATVIWFLATLLYQYRRLKQRWWQHWLLAAILMVDLLLAGKTINVYAPETFFTEIPEVVPLVQKTIGKGRLFRDSDPLSFTLDVPSHEVMWLYRWAFEVLRSYVASFYNIPIIFHDDVDAMADSHLREMTGLIGRLPWEQRLPLLSTGGVTVILTSKTLSLPGIHRLAEIPNRSNLPFYLYQNETAAARVQFITSWEEVHSDDEAFAAMLRPNYDPRTHVILQKPEPSLFESYPTISVEPPHSSRNDDCEPANITKMTSKNHSAVFAISNRCDGYLVFSEPYHPGWRVTIDGNQTPILRANYIFSAIALPTGDHEVIRYYRPNSLIYGAVTSLIFCGILGVLSWKEWVIT